MSDNKKKRLSMLDNLANAGSAPTANSMMAASRPLRAARNAVDGHKVWDLDPDQIIDTRVADRLDHTDVADLRDSIEATGQSVPILVRRHPGDDAKYLLVYGRRRLEAIRSSATVEKVRALIATLDDDAATDAQISENMARRDLTYIEKALFAQELIQSGYGKQIRVAEVLTVPKSAISMGIAIVDSIGADLIRAIGPAEGIGRPRWDALARGLDTTTLDRDGLIDVAERARSAAQLDVFATNNTDDLRDPSVVAFEAVIGTVTPQNAPKPAAAPKPVTRITPLKFADDLTGKVSRTKSGLRMEVADGPFADWLEDQAVDLMQELHQRWEHRTKNT